MEDNGMPFLLQRRIAGLDSLQNEVEALELVHERRLRELEKDFHAQSQKILERRGAIVAGTSEPTEEEVSASTLKPLDYTPESAADESCPPGIPGFWMTAMMQCDALHDPDKPFFTEKDWMVLQHLEDVRAEPWVPPAHSWEELTGEDFDEEDIEAARAVEDEEDRALGFALHFTFARDSPFLVPPEGDAPVQLSLYCHGHGEVAHAEPAAIAWREGADPTVETRTKKKKNKRTGAIAEKTTHEKVSSFFNLFTPVTEADFEERGSAARLSDELLEEVAEMSERVCLGVKENLVPHATAYFIQDLLDDGEDDQGFGRMEEMLKQEAAEWEEEQPKKGKGKKQQRLN